MALIANDGLMLVSYNVPAKMVALVSAPEMGINVPALWVSLEFTVDRVIVDLFSALTKYLAD